MKQKIFLTSALAMGFVAPAFAEPSNTGTFPSDGYMEEDYTYTNAATSDNMDGVYSGTVNAVAEYDTIDYILSAGKYLPADSETITTCPAGSFCAGGDTVQYNQSSDQGIQTCPTGYDSSVAGASSDTECYRQCSGNVTIEHATGVNGNDYYGNGADTCEPTGCVNGWHLKQGINNPDLMTLVGANATAIDAVSNKNNGLEQSNYNGMTSADAGISGEPNAFVVDYGDKGIIKGYGRCNTQSGTRGNEVSGTYPNITIRPTLTNETGQSGAQYCYCHLDSYTASGSNTAIALSGPWVYWSDFGDKDSCKDYCASNCTLSMFSNTVSVHVSFRDAIFNAYQPSLATCEANTITINWSDASQTDIDANNAGTATYGSDVRTPVKAQTKKGKTFKGWRFSKPTTTNLPE